MRIFKLARVLLSVICLCLLITGCLTKKYIPHNQYLLNIPAPEAIKWSLKRSTLFVYPIHVRTPFDQLNFLYRITREQYLTDYYNGFITSLAEQLYPVLIKYLKGTGHFNLATNMYVEVPREELQVEVTEIYADYRDRMHPKAKATVNFLLSRHDEKGKSITLLEKSLSLALPLRGKNTESLLKAWEQIFRSLLSQGVYSIIHAK